MEPALEMMADVSANFHVAFMRYVDNVAKAIDKKLPRGIEMKIHSALKARLPPIIYFLNTTIMSPSATPAVEDDEPARKKRRPGACDLCKKRKSDSSQMPNNRCTHCVQTGSECTHHEVTKNLDTGRGRKYVEGLEQRLVNMEKLFERLLPGVNLADEIEKANEAENAPEVPADLGNLPRNDDDSPEARMVSRFQKLHLQPDAHRFYGKSSGVMLLKATIEVMDQYAATKPGFRPRDRGMRRPEYWNQCPWQIRASDYQEQRMLQFPEDDLMNHLVDLYFKYINPFLPLLHRYTFEGLIKQGEHFKDREFGGVLLLVCANASRYSDDPRVLLPGANSQHSAGWKYYQQVTVVRSNLLKKPTLYELQMYALSVCYGQGSSRPQGCWTEVGFGLRMAMDVGAHRRRTGKPTPQYELWKRAFWVLHVLDTSLSSFFGHPCTLHTDEFDLDTLVECDDEYWDTGDPETNMQQPKGKPSYVAFFNCYARLMEIYSYAMRMLYYTRKPSMYNNKATPTQVILKLDSACNAWLDSIPSHLRWDPNRQDQLFFDQSACLYSVFYHLQIFIHKPFITSLQDPASMTFPSLAICTSAARSCARIIETQSRRSPVPMTLVQSAIFISGLTLLLNIWITKQSGLTINPKDMQDVWKCMQTLSAAEGRWHIAGKLWDILRELASAGDLDINAHISASDQQTKKRPRDNTEASSTSSPAVEAIANASPASSASTPPETPSAYMRSLQQYAMHAAANGNGAELNAPEVPQFSDEQVETFHFMNGYMNGQYAMPAGFGTGSAREFGAQDFAASGSGQDFVQNDPMMEFGMFGMGDGMTGMGLNSPGFGAGTPTSGGTGSGLEGDSHGMASGSSPAIAATGLGAGASRLNGLGVNGAMSNGLSASSSTVGSSPSSLHAAEGGSPHTPAVQGNFWNPAPSPFETDAWQRYLSNVDDPGYPQAPSVVNSLSSGPNQQAQLPSRMNPLSQSGLGQAQMPPPSQALLGGGFDTTRLRSGNRDVSLTQITFSFAYKKLANSDSFPKSTCGRLRGTLASTPPSPASPSLSAMAKPGVNPMVDLQCRSRAIRNKFRQLKELLALTKLKTAEFRRDVETATQEVKAHIDKAWITRATADTCAHLVARLHGVLKLCVSQDLGEDHFLPFFEPLDELANISSLTLALQTLQASMHTHLVYPHGLNNLVYAGIVPLVQGREFPVAFHRAEALLQGVPLATQIDELVEENRRTALQWREVWEEATGHFRPRLILQIRRLPDDVRAQVIAPVFAATKMCWEYKLKLERTAILIADV
ncbi:fungal-specific transcription factor domain-containing protein [Schizophyllum commune]